MRAREGVALVGLEDVEEIVILDFNDESKQVKEKNDRQTYLQEFNDYLNDQNCMSTVIIPHLDLVINMIEKNIFRPLPVLKKQGLPGEGVGMEEVTLFS